MSEKRCYSVSEIQDILGICKMTAYNLIKENQFRSILVGGKYRISKKSFDAWLDGELEKNEPENEKGKEEEKSERDGKGEKPESYDASADIMKSILTEIGHHAR